MSASLLFCLWDIEDRIADLDIELVDVELLEYVYND